MTRLVLFAALGLSAPALAVPVEMVHQGRLFDSSAVPLDGTHDLTLGLYAAPAGGTPVWTDTFSTGFDDGYFTVRLGSGTPLDPDDFDTDELYLALTVDSGAELPTRHKLSSVPWAFHAQTATSVSGGVVDATEVRINGTTVIDSTGPDVDWSDLTGIPTGFADGVDDGGWSPPSTCSSGEVMQYDGSAWNCHDASDHTHDITQITSISNHSHTQSQVSDFAHTHAASEITGGSVSLPSGETITIGGEQLDENFIAGLRGLFVPQLNAPADGATVSDTDQLAWTGVSAPFIVEVASDSAFSSPQSLSVSENQITLADFIAGTSPLTEGTWYWRVTGTGYGVNETSSVRTFDFAFGWGTQDRPADDCDDLLGKAPATGDGVYWIDPDGSGGQAPFQAYCLMSEFPGEGWTVLAHAPSHQAAGYFVRGTDRNAVADFTNGWNQTGTFTSVTSPWFDTFRGFYSYVEDQPSIPQTGQTFEVWVDYQSTTGPKHFAQLSSSGFTSNWAVQTSEGASCTSWYSAFNQFWDTLATGASGGSGGHGYCGYYHSPEGWCAQAYAVNQCNRAGYGAYQWAWYLAR